MCPLSLRALDARSGRQYRGYRYAAQPVSALYSTEEPTESDYPESNSELGNRGPNSRQMVKRSRHFDTSGGRYCIELAHVPIGSDTYVP